jgi:hypothetical protein
MTAGEEQVEKRKDLPTYTLAEVKKHNTPKDLWIAINGAVYDVTKFQDRHPGGSSSLTDHAGASRDARAGPGARPGKGGRGSRFLSSRRRIQFLRTR